MGTTVKLTKDENGLDVDPTLYKSMIGSLLYLIASCPDICYSIGVCDGYQANLKKSHLATVTVDYGIWHYEETNVNLLGFCDADWAGNVDDKKSTSGGCFYLGNNFILWHNRKQNSI